MSIAWAQCLWQDQAALKAALVSLTPLCWTPVDLNTVSDISHLLTHSPSVTCATPTTQQWTHSVTKRSHTGEHPGANSFLIFVLLNSPVAHLPLSHTLFLSPPYTNVPTPGCISDPCAVCVINPLTQQSIHPSEHSTIGCPCVGQVPPHWTAMERTELQQESDPLNKSTSLLAGSSTFPLLSSLMLFTANSSQSH